MQRRKNQGSAQVVIVILILLAAIGGTIFLIMSSINKRYQAGSYSNNVYESKWANVSIKLPEGYQKLADPTGTLNGMDAHMFRSNTSVIIIATQEQKNTNLEKEMQSLSRSFSTTAVKGAQIVGQPVKTVKIAGEKYSCLTFDVIQGLNKVAMSLYAREVHNNGFIMIMMVSGSQKEIENFINNNISKYK